MKLNRAQINALKRMQQEVPTLSYMELRRMVTRAGITDCACLELDGFKFYIDYHGYIDC